MSPQSPKDVPAAAVTPAVQHLPELPRDLSDLEAMLDDPRAPELVQQLPSTHIHRLVCQIGRQDVSELLALASPEQVREVLDLELWDGDRLKRGETVDWLRFLGTLPFKTCHKDMLALDRELIGTVLLNHVRVYLVQDETAPEEPEGCFYESPDRWYILDIVTEEQGETDRLIELLNMMYRMDQEYIRTLILEIQWSLPTEIEELSFRWRNNRLQDLGFADPHEALMIYAYLDPGSVDPQEGTADRFVQIEEDRPHGADLDILPSEKPSFWQTAVGRVQDPRERERISQFLMVLSNRCLSADRIPPADLEQAQLSLERLHWRLSLGLEHISGGNLQIAEEALTGVALQRIARVGHSLALDLRRRLLAPLRQSALGHGPGRLELLDGPLRTQIAAIALPRPLYQERQDSEPRPFQTIQDLERANEWIDTALAASTLLERMQISLPDDPPDELTAADLYRTSVANYLLSREGPLDLGALRRFLISFNPGVLESYPHPSPLSAAEGRLLEAWQAGLMEVTGRLQPDDLDPRFIDGFLLT